MRLELHEMALERKGYVSGVENNKDHIKICTGFYRGKDDVVELKKIENATEICSCPLFYGLKKTVDGEMKKNQLFFTKTVKNLCRKKKTPRPWRKGE